MIAPLDRQHEFFVMQGQDGKWRWAWLLPMREAALKIEGLCGYKTRRGALRSAYAQTDKLRRMMVDLSRGDMI
jgi:hypothetical protein